MPAASPLDDSLALLADEQEEGATPQPAAAATVDASYSPTATATAPAPAPTPASSAPSPARASVSASSSSSTPDKAGWMEKNSYDSPAVFNSYYFVLRDNQLSYFLDEESEFAKGVIALEGCSCDIVPADKHGLAACFELNSPLQGRLYALGCESAETMQQWINVIRSCMLKIRRAKAKEATAKKRLAIDGAAAESQLAQQAHRDQQQAMANAALSSANEPHATTQNAYTNSYNHVATADAPPSASMQSGSTVVHPAHGGSVGLSASPEERHSVYTTWLADTRAGKNKPGAGAGGRGSMSGELHHTLLDDDRTQSTFESTCSRCCPAWCFR